MENQELSFDQPILEDEPLTLPHFDDEATVQSARPVVPLHEVRRAALTRLHLLLGGALCLAAVVGALVASLIYNRTTPQAPEATAETISEPAATSPDFVAPSGEASGSTINPHDAVATNADMPAKNDEGSERIVTKAVPRNNQPTIRNSRVETRPDRVVDQSKIDDRSELELRAEEEMLREQRREARRARRERLANDGLTRIREIFEGSPRP